MFRNRVYNSLSSVLRLSGMCISKRRYISPLLVSPKYGKPFSAIRKTALGWVPWGTVTVTGFSSVETFISVPSTASTI